MERKTSTAASLTQAIMLGPHPHHRSSGISLHEETNFAQESLDDMYLEDLIASGRKEFVFIYSKTYVKRPLFKILKIGFKDKLSINKAQKYCRMLPLEHSAILLTFIKLPYDIKTFVVSVFKWPFYTGFTVVFICQIKQNFSVKL